MEDQDSIQVMDSLVFRVEKGADAVEIADAIVSTWRKVDAALNPIIGHGGVAALYKRSLSLAAQAHPWLAGAHEGVQTAMDLAALKAVLAQQCSADTAAGGGALLNTFYQLLTGLIGTSLTGQLLSSVWTNAFQPPPAE